MGERSRLSLGQYPPRVVRPGLKHHLIRPDMQVALDKAGMPQSAFRPLLVARDIGRAVVDHTERNSQVTQQRDRSLKLRSPIRTPPDNVSAEKRERCTGGQSIRLESFFQIRCPDALIYSRDAERFDSADFHSGKICLSSAILAAACSAI